MLFQSAWTIIAASPPILLQPSKGGGKPPGPFRRRLGRSTASPQIERQAATPNRAVNDVVMLKRPTIILTFSTAKKK